MEKKRTNSICIVGFVLSFVSSIAGFGPIAAKSLYEAAKSGEEFMSIDEVRLAAKLGDSTVDLLREFGVFEGMQESNQISLFG